MDADAFLPMVEANLCLISALLLVHGKQVPHARIQN